MDGTVLPYDPNKNIVVPIDGLDESERYNNEEAVDIVMYDNVTKMNDADNDNAMNVDSEWLFHIVFSQEKKCKTCLIV